ncbi:MAG: WbqC family protein [Elusimicrobia bacterium]|nr:WbqC family protein [Elusimicrobiota bacterium]
MILTAHQPVYLPWLGLFHKIALSDAFCSFDDVQYLKRDWNSRNQIKTASGPIWLTVPVLSTGHREKPIREIEIDNSSDWRRKHWKSIHLNYKKAPYFSRYADYFEEVYRTDWKYLTDLNEAMLKWFLKELGIKAHFHKASDLHFEGHKSGLVLDMCRKMHADLYIFGILGKDYAKEDEFSPAGIKIYFQDYKHPVYPQLHGDFVPYMSIIDLLFNCGDSSFDILMSGNIAKCELPDIWEGQ